jgi:preprotein translocase subunit SecY
VKSLPARLAITILVPIALYVISGWLLVPGADELLSGVPLSSRTVDMSRSLSVFALGVMPAMTAFGIVELVAFLVPRLRRLRHGNPEGRAKLDRAARALTMVLAAIQAFAVAMSLKSLSQSIYFAAMPPPTWILVATLVGGVCVQMIAADFITRQRITNGYVLLVVVAGVIEFGSELRQGLYKRLVTGMLEPQEHLYLVGSVALVGFASAVVLRGANDTRIAGGDEAKGGPYRVASNLVVRPWLPIPASSFTPWFLASSLIMLPATLAPFMGRTAHTVTSLDDKTFAIVFLSLIVVLSFALAYLLHRRNELVDLASRLGLVVAADARVSVARAMPPTVLFFAVLLLASNVARGAHYARVEVSFIPLVVAILLDMGAALRKSNFVPVWAERRASAVPVVRAVLEAEGITVETRGLATLSLLQVFAPYAPAELAVAPTDAERAVGILRHVFLGEEKPAPASKGNADTAPAADGDRLKRMSIALAVASVLAFGGAIAAHMPSRPKLEPGERRPDLEVVVADDLDETIRGMREEDLPSGFEIRWESVPHGRGHHEKSYFVSVHSLPNERVEQTFARADAWARTVKLPEGRRLAFETVEEWDSDSSTSKTTGVRSVMLMGEPILTTADVTDAMPSTSEASGLPEVYVLVTLTPEAGERFADATEAHVEERIAIVVDGRVNSVPVVKTRIAGGRISITMGRGDPEKQLADAKKLARGLGAR